MAFARARWRYSATSGFSGEDLLAGRTSQIPCGGIANALKIVLQGVLKDPALVRFHTLSGYLVTKPRYTCFDPLVRGNVRNAAGIFDGSCLFNQHYFLSWGGLYYDPCMTAVYLAETDLVDVRPVPVQRLRAVRVFARPGATKADDLYFSDRSIPAAGFESVYLRVPIRGITNVETLRNALSPAVAEALGQTPEDARVIVELCSQAV